MVRACGSYPQCPGFDSLHRHQNFGLAACPGPPRTGAFVLTRAYRSWKTGRKNSMRQLRFLLLVLPFVLVLAVGGCGLQQVRPRLDQPSSADDSGLLLAERVEMNFVRESMLGLTPRPETSSVYFGHLEPGGEKIVFRRAGAGTAFLTWLPQSWNPAGNGAVILTGHQVSGSDGRFSNGWPEGLEIRLPIDPQPGRVFYLGVIERRLYLVTPEFDPEHPDDIEYPPPRVEVAMKADPEKQAVLGLLVDNPWLENMLTGPNDHTD